MTLTDMMMTTAQAHTLLENIKPEDIKPNAMMPIHEVISTYSKMLRLFWSDMITLDKSLQDLGDIHSPMTVMLKTIRDKMATNFEETKFFK